MIRLRDGTWEKGIAQQDLELRVLGTVEIVASAANLTRQLKPEEQASQAAELE